MTTTTASKKMSISSETLDLLKNFSTINSNILVKEGNTIRTISNYKNVLAEATVEESFGTEFGIWDLTKFLGTVSLFESPVFKFDERCVTIEGETGAKVVYYYCEPKLLTTITKEIKMPEAVVTCELFEYDFKEIQKSASVLQLPDLKISSEDDKVVLTVQDRKDPSSNTYAMEIGDHDDDSTFEFFFKAENLKMLSGDYNVEICKNSVAKFTNKNKDLKYWVAMEPDSIYNEG
jgi:hypothetical protein